MGITIHKDEVGIKFFANSNDVEPVAVIYSGGKTGVINDDLIVSRSQAESMAQVMLIAGVFIQSINTTEADLRKKAFKIAFRGKIMDGEEDHLQKYTAKQILSNIYSGSVVTVNKKTRLKYEFVDFSFRGDELVVNYKPVIW